MFTVVERDGGRVVATEIVGTAGLEHRLWLIARDRRLSIEPQPARSCPSCGARRIANFRWCQSCGIDFEPWREELTPAATRPVAPALAPATGSTSTVTVERPSTVTRSAPVATAPGHRSAAAPAPRAAAAGVAVFVLDPATAATASSAGRASSGADASPVTVGIASDRRPPAPNPVRVVLPDPPTASPAPAVARGRRRRVAEWVDDVLADDRFDLRRLGIGAVIGLAIGIIVTVLVLAIE